MAEPSNTQSQSNPAPEKESDESLRARLADKVKDYDEDDRKEIEQKTRNASGDDLTKFARTYNVKRKAQSSADQDQSQKQTEDQAREQYLAEERRVHETVQGETEETRGQRIRTFYGSTPRPIGLPTLPSVPAASPDPAAIARDAQAQSDDIGRRAGEAATREAQSSLDARTGPGMSLAQQRQASGPESDENLRKRIVEANQDKFKSAYDRSQVEETSGEDLDKLAKRHGVERRKQIAPSASAPAPGLVAPPALGPASPAPAESDAEYRRRLEPAMVRELMKGFHDMPMEQLDQIGRDLGIERLPSGHPSSPLAAAEGHEQRRHGSPRYSDQDSTAESFHHKLDSLLAAVVRIEGRLKHFA